MLKRLREVKQKQCLTARSCGTGALGAGTVCRKGKVNAGPESLALGVAVRGTGPTPGSVPKQP